MAFIRGSTTPARPEDDVFGGLDEGMADEIGVGYEELYSRFFEQQSKSLDRMSHWWQVINDTATGQLTALEKRLLELEKRIRESAR